MDSTSATDRPLILIYGDDFFEGAAGGDRRHVGGDFGTTATSDPSGKAAPIWTRWSKAKQRWIKRTDFITCDISP